MSRDNRSAETEVIEAALAWRAVVNGQLAGRTAFRVAEDLLAALDRLLEARKDFAR